MMWDALAILVVSCLVLAVLVVGWALWKDHH
jgi:hypothetical protein